MTNTQPKVYVLLKDILNYSSGEVIKAGEEFKRMEGTRKFISTNGWHMDEAAILRTEWFKEKQQPIKERIPPIECYSIKKLGGRPMPTTKYSECDVEYLIKTTLPIPKEKYEAVKQAIEGVLNNDNNITSIDNAGVMAVKISEMCNPKLTTQEQAFFISGFQECIKWMQLGCPEPQPQEDTKEDNPDWEIVSCRYKTNGVVYPFTAMPDDKFEIHSVRRKSDNEVFTVGDRCFSRVNKVTNDCVKDIKVVNNTIYINSIPLENAVKYPF